MPTLRDGGDDNARPRQTRRTPTPAPAPSKNKKRGWLSTATDFAGDVLDNVTPNWGDEWAGLWGGIGSAIDGRGYWDGYEAESQRFRERQEQYDRDHPKLAWGSTIAGALGGLALPAGKVAQGASRAQRARQGATAGAAYSALAGAGEGEGLQERATNAAMAAPLGAATGYVAPGIIEDAIQAAPKAVQSVRGVLSDVQGSVPRRPAGDGKTSPKGALASDNLKAVHYSFEPNLTETDPAFWGSNRTAGFIPREERARMGSAPKRTHFGLSEGPGVTKPYSKEGGLGPYEYSAELPSDRVYNWDTEDHAWLRDQIGSLPQDSRGRYLYNGRALDGGALTEQLIKDAGYLGYRRNEPSLGDVVQAFEPVPVQRVQQPIDGAPTKLGPYDPLRASARQYADQAGIEYTPPTQYAPVDEVRARGVAQAYEQMPHNPRDPDVAEAYGALARETIDQYRDLEARGYRFGFDDPANPAYPSPYDAIRDLRDNRSMKVFPTDAGYGAGGITDEMIAENPLLASVDGVTWDGQPVRVNDLFRAVHDAYGHAKEGFGFRAAGEENAFRQHLPMFSPAAQRALATETRGQNSWLNFGPNAEFNQAANQADTIYAAQKIGLMPDEFALGGTEDFMPDPRGTAYGYRGNAGRRGEARIRNDEGLLSRLAELGLYP